MQQSEQYTMHVQPQASSVCFFLQMQKKNQEEEEAEEEEMIKENRCKPKRVRREYRIALCLLLGLAQKYTLIG